MEYAAKLAGTQKKKSALANVAAQTMEEARRRNTKNLTTLRRPSKMSYERPLCDACRKRPADVQEEGVNLCGKCYAAYRNINLRENSGRL
jgi:hypothetical protein